MLNLSVLKKYRLLIILCSIIVFCMSSSYEYWLQFSITKKYLPNIFMGLLIAIFISKIYHNNINIKYKNLITLFLIFTTYFAMTEYFHYCKFSYISNFTIVSKWLITSNLSIDLLSYFQILQGVFLYLYIILRINENSNTQKLNDSI